MPSKAVLVRQKSAESVLQIGQAQGETVRSGVLAFFQPLDGGGPAPADVMRLADLGLAVLNLTRQSMVLADRNHENELGDDPAVRDARDEVAAALVATLVDMRRLLLGLAGEARLPALGFDGESPRDPALLVGFATRVAGQLLAAGTIAGRDGLSWKVESAANGLQADGETLQGHLTAVAREEREAQATLAAKNRAIAVHDEAFRRVATYLVGLFTLAGQPDLAARVRPSKRRSGLTAVDAQDPAEAEA